MREHFTINAHPRQLLCLPLLLNMKTMKPIGIKNDNAYSNSEVSVFVQCSLYFAENSANYFSHASHWESNIDWGRWTNISHKIENFPSQRFSVFIFYFARNSQFECLFIIVKWFATSKLTFWSSVLKYNVDRLVDWFCICQHYNKRKKELLNTFRLYEILESDSHMKIKPVRLFFFFGHDLKWMSGKNVYIDKNGKITNWKVFCYVDWLNNVLHISNKKLSKRK